MSDTYRMIRKDHQHHRELLDRISKTQGNFKERKKLWDAFYYDVKSHAAAEEETFYSKLMEDTHGQDDARHSVAEHQELDEIMEELNGMDLSGTGWLNRFATLKHDYKHHMEEEEKDIFAKAREVFGDQEASTFGERFGHRKAEERKLVEKKAAESLDD